MSDKVTKYFIGKVRSVDPKTFSAEVVISDETKDRYDERVLVQSFKKTKKDFMKHPVLLSSHAYRGLMNQLGMFTSLKIDEEKKEVVASPKWFVGEGNPEADWGWKLAEKGIAAFSIGFIPKKTVRYDEEARAKNGGIWCDYEEIELLEVSQVLIPANPSALQKSFGDVGDDLFLKELSEKIFELFKESTEPQDKGIEWGDEKKEGDEETDEGKEAQLSLEIENKKWEETDSEIRHRVREPENFEKFRTIKIKKDKPRVNAIYGKLKGKDEWQIQALRFPKEDGWNLESAKNWVKEHPDVVKFLEDIDFEEDSDSPKDMSELKEFFVEALASIKELVDKKEPVKEEKTETPLPKEKENDTSLSEVVGEEKLAEIRASLFGDLNKLDTKELKNLFDSATEEVKRIFSVQR